MKAVLFRFFHQSKAFVITSLSANCYVPKQLFYRVEKNVERQNLPRTLRDVSRVGAPCSVLRPRLELAHKSPGALAKAKPGSAGQSCSPRPRTGHEPPGDASAAGPETTGWRACRWPRFSFRLRPVQPRLDVMQSCVLPGVR